MEILYLYPENFDAIKKKKCISEVYVTINVSFDVLQLKSSI